MWLRRVQETPPPLPFPPTRDEWMVFTSKTMESSWVKCRKWKEIFEREWRVTLKRQKLLSWSKGEILNRMIDPISVSRRREMANSLLCTKCKKWIHSVWHKSLFVQDTRTKLKGEWEPTEKLCNEAQTVNEFCHLGVNVRQWYCKDKTWQREFREC